MSRYFALAVLTFLTGASVLSTPARGQAKSVESPAANIPHVASLAPGSRAVTLDGRIESSEWRGSAILYPAMEINQADAHERPTPRDPGANRTTVYLKHDDRHLWVAVDCVETSPGYPEAYPRPPGGNFSQEDTVQIVLGLADRSVVQRDVLDMGGYEGALGAAGVAADNYYQYIVNAAGARERQWNELPLKTPRFESAVARTKSGWSIEYKIPLDSFGATLDVRRHLAEDNDNIFLNVIRFRPPAMTGWHLPAFGGYRPMPFGRVKLLPAPVPAGAFSGTITPAVVSAQKLATTIETPGRITTRGGRARPADRIEIGYYPLNGSIIGIIDGSLPAPAAHADRAVLRVTGQPDIEIKLNSGQRRQLAILPLTPGSQPARKAEFVLYAKNKPVHTATRDLPAVTAPEWFGTDAGADYLDKKIPAPWRQPLVDETARIITLVDKTLRIGPWGLPDSVRHGETDTFAGPAEIFLAAKGRDIPLKPASSVVRLDGNSARATATATGATPAGSVTLETKTHVDFDGFTVVKMRLHGIAPGDISRFTVRLPVNPAVARYTHRVHVQQIAALDGFGYSGPAGPLWTGNLDQGIAFAADTPLFVSADKRHQLRLVEAPGKPTWLELNIVDAAGQLTPDAPAANITPDGSVLFRFILQPTPTRPRPALLASPRVISYKFEMWSDWQGYPDLAKLPEVKKWSENLLSTGRVPTLYTCQGLSEKAPWFAEFKEDMMIQPPWMFYRRHHEPDKGTPVWATSKRGPEGDLQLWAFRKLANEAGVSGILSDGLSVPWADDNPGNACGGGQPAPLDWDADQPSRLVAQRDFLKRLRGIFSDTGRPIAFIAHTGGGLEPHTLSFFDYYVEGEQLSRFPINYRPPLSTYAVGYSGQPFGHFGTFWVKRWIRSDGPYWSLTYALLHNNQMRDNDLYQDVMKTINEDGVPVFHPWWRPMQHVAIRSQTGDTRLSYYKGHRAALLAVGNFGLAPDTLDIAIDLPALFADTGAGDLPTVAEDVLTGTRIPIENGRIRQPLAPGKCLALRIEKQDANKTVSAPWKAAAGIEGWESAAPASAVPATLTAPDGQTVRALALASAKGKDAGEARARYTRHMLLNDGSLEFLLKPQNRFAIHLGATAIVYNNDEWRTEGVNAAAAYGLSGESSTNAENFVPADIPRPGWPNLGTLFQPTLKTGKDNAGGVHLLRITLTGRILDATIDNQPLAKGVVWTPEGCPVGSPRPPLEIALSTTGGDSLTFAPLAMSSEPVALYEGGLISARVTAAPVQPPFDLENIPPARWTVKKGRGVKTAVGTLDAQPALTIKSGADRAIATLDQTVGDTFSAILKIEKMPARCFLRIGPVNLRHDPRWVLDGPLNGWGRGIGPRTADKATSPQPAIPDGSPAVIRISMKNGVLDMVVNDQLLVRGVAFDIPKSGNTLTLETWGNFGATFRLLKLSSEPAVLYAPLTTEHPVL
ncbi:hypothetical protein OpiT1DRAFT_02403 [Opitutaceae bacterium TAV1]|nr:hypothetical protein OpiT1DRAFT_02403 [Opitutaceae bacterium TAV1]